MGSRVRGNNAFTLVEILIVMAILVVMIVMAVGIFNSAGVFNKARDARRKKDIGRIKVAFEEYYSDKGCYPSVGIGSSLMDQLNCGSRIVFNPWLSPWQCDPGRIPYQIVVETPFPVIIDNCSKWFKILTKLENQSDTDIPPGWNQGAGWEYRTLGGNSTAETANFGVSSPNVVWSDYRANPECAAYGGCYYQPGVEICNAIAGCVGPNCYLGICKSSCLVSCCGEGCK